jgi:hypothetical protein
MEISIEIIGALVIIVIALSGLFASILQRLTKLESCVDPQTGDSIARLETKVDYMLKWIAALNGEMREGKDFEKLLDKIKEVAKDKGL